MATAGSAGSSHYELATGLATFIVVGAAKVRRLEAVTTYEPADLRTNRPWVRETALRF